VSKLFVLAACAACYGPESPECVLACTSDTDCVSGQACTSDGFCAPSGTTQCVQHQAPVDAAMVTADARDMPDAGSGSGSGTTTVSVHVTVDGNGTVTASTGTACTGDCTFAVAKDVPMTFTATPNSPHQHFDNWSGACAAQPALCHVTPTTAITVGAKFTGGGGD
jgi:hypothetical protein